MQPVANLAFIGGIGPMEWGILLVIALLLFGRRLPEVMRGMGSGVREFRKGIAGEVESPAPQDAARPAEVVSSPARDAAR